MPTWRDWLQNRDAVAAALELGPALAEGEARFVGDPVALVVAVVLTAVLEVLDITIVSVAIPHMLGDLATIGAHRRIADGPARDEPRTSQQRRSGAKAAEAGAWPHGHAPERSHEHDEVIGLLYEEYRDFD